MDWITFNRSTLLPDELRESLLQLSDEDLFSILRSAECEDSSTMSSIIRETCSMVKTYSVFFQYEYQQTEYVRRCVSQFVEKPRTKSKSKEQKIKKSMKFVKFVPIFALSGNLQE